MKKIININLSGRVIPIEDTAYEKLKEYIESLRRYFANEDGRDEIINDIESRIAELMNEKIRKGAACITDADIDEISASMGRPEDFEKEDADTADSAKQKTSQSYSYEERRTHRRLYRDSSDKFIGGVCSGIANYLNVDPAIIRILFAIIAFGSFGLGLFIYIVLWIFLPDKDLEGYSGKRLYRNPEDRILGGVAGGLAAYFNTRPSSVRLIFAAPFLLSILFALLRGLVWHPGDFDIFPNFVFGSLGSTAVVAYIILWIVLPEARSPYEKMEMRGEKVDVNSIRQNMKERMKDWSEEVKSSAENFGNKAKEFANTKGKTFAGEFGRAAGRAGSGVGHAIGVIFKVFFLFIAGAVAFALFAALLALLFGGIAWWPVNNFLWTSKWQQIFAWGTIIFFLLVPLVGFFIWLIRRIAGIRPGRSYLGWVFGSLWVIGWISAISLAASITGDFRVLDDRTEVNIPVAQPANGRMTVLVSEPKLEYNGNFNWMDNDIKGWDISDDSMKLSIIKFNITKSADSTYQVILRKRSFGKTRRDAENRAEQIYYAVYSKDSILDIGNGYVIGKENKFRGQHVELEIRVPVGKKIVFDASVKDKLNPASIRVRRKWDDHGINFNVDEDEYFRRLRPNADYIMDSSGNLRGPGNEKINDSNNKEDKNNYRYQYRDNGYSPVRRESLDDKSAEYQTSSSSPFFSLVKTYF